MGYKMTTVNGYDFFEAASALQKEIRRGNQEEAMYWALEFAESYSDYLWYRLTIIVNEDIGLASPRTIWLVEALHQQYEYVKKKKGPGWRIVLGNAILAMCKAKKTRLADNFICAITHRRDSEGWRLEVPDYALDRHTQRGRSMKRGFEHFRDVGCQLRNEAKGMDGYEKEAMDARQKYGKISKEQPGNGKRGSLDPSLFKV